LAEAQADLRERYGTRTLETAQHIDRAIEHAHSKRPADALKEVDAALQAEPQCQLALYWKGQILGDLGDIDQGIASYTKAMDIPSGRSLAITVDSAINAGLMLAQTERRDEANLMMSRAILEDPDDKAHLRWKALRNMAITLHLQHKEFSAGVVALLARQADPRHVEQQMPDSFLKQAGNQEVARVLFFKDEPSTPQAREPQGALSALEIGGEEITERIADILPDPRGEYSVAVASGTDHYYLVEGKDKLSVHRVDAGAVVTGACLVDGQLYVSTAEPPEIRQLDARNGKVIHRTPIHGPAPQTLAVFPSKSLAFYPVGQHVHRVELQTGSDEDTGQPGQFVRADPLGKFLYAFTKPIRQAPDEGMILLNGHPIFIRRNAPMDWSQTTLFQYVVTSGRLLLAQLRENSASNADNLAVSPDGKWVAVIGGGGWRSSDPANKSGYVIPVYGATNLEKVMGPFQTDAYPGGLATNPVTQQVVAIHEQDARLYDLAGVSGETIRGKFSGHCAWTGDGRLLLLGNADHGLTAYSNPLNKSEEAIASSWWKSQLPNPSKAVKSSGGQGPLVPNPELTAFKISEARETVHSALATALSRSAANRPTPWDQSTLYNSNPEQLQTARDLEGAGADAQANGVRIYKLRKALEKSPNFAPLRLFLGEAYRANGQFENARDAYLAAVHSDAGRSDLSKRALLGLAVLLAGHNQEMAAVHCLATALSADRDDPQVVELIQPLLKSLGFPEELGRLKNTGPSTNAADASIRPLPLPTSAKILTGPQVFQQAVSSVVLIKCGPSSGTGICIGKAGQVLTNYHIIDGGEPIEITTYVLKDGAPAKSATCRASIISSSPRQDLAVLRVTSPPTSLVPLQVVAKDPRVGQKIYAVGNPGLGDRVLEQTMSEGIVSSVGRVINGSDFIQHTAAVNPGNSGGPLLDESGQVVGMITLQAALENVSFAIPASRIRAMFDNKLRD
jgi:S1-C subfamily serine protease